MGSNRENDGRVVLVVGGAGYVGNVLVRRLLASGYQVRVLDDLLFDHGSALAGVFEEPGFSFLRGDLCVEGDLERALDGVTDVVLLAALVGDPLCKKYPGLARKVNTEGSKRLFSALNGRGIDRFVFTSTCSNYGLRDTDEPATEESELAPLSLYAETKVELERFVLGQVSEVDLCPTILRVATAYGLSQRMRFDLTISEFTRTLAVGEELLVYDPDTWRPYCHVGDISRAVRTVLESPSDAVRGEVFNVGHSDENYTKRMIVETVLERLPREGRVRYTEGGSDPRNYRVAFDKIASKLGFEPEFRIPVTVGNLIGAIDAGAFDDVDERPRFYTNHSVVSGHAAEDETPRVHAVGADEG
jgi:nucleoside-diphosphate-sugar epimerase